MRYKKQHLPELYPTIPTNHHIKRKKKKNCVLRNECMGIVFLWASDLLKDSREQKPVSIKSLAAVFFPLSISETKAL